MNAVIIHSAPPGMGGKSNRIDSGQCDCDCDCACASPSPRLDPVNLADSSLVVSTAQPFPVRADWYGLCNPSGAVSVAVLNRPAHDLWQKFQASQTLDALSLNDEQLQLTHQMLQAGLLKQTHSLEYPISSDNNYLLTSWLHLTDRCNLRCSYCYLPHVREDMSSETGHAAIDAIFRSAVANGFKQVKLKYAGGEPLLRFALVEELHTYAQQLAEQNEIELEGVVLSNGTLLTAEIVETLKSMGLRLMISLDGMGQYHDSHRPYAGGRGSFADVADAVDLALSNDLSPTISVTVSSRTAEGLPEIMAWMLSRNLSFSLNFYRENELSASHEDMQLDEKKIIAGMLAAFKVIEENLPRRPFLGGIVDRANLSSAHTHTCGVGENYLVFDQNGQVAKCQMHIRKPVTDVHAADPLALIRADQIGIQNLPVLEKDGCKTCEWKHWCAGGCPLTTHRATGRYDVKSPNCKIYKALFPEALRLEGLRLLKYQDDPEVVVKL